MLSYNKIIQLNRDFATNHWQIKTFGNGAAYNIVLHDKEDWFTYPLMWMEDLPFPLNDKEFQFYFRVYFIAQVAQLEDQETDLDSTNENEVKSDMIQCAQDLLSFWGQDSDYSDLILVKSGIVFNTITDKFSDRVTGCYIDLKLKQGFTYNKCAIPMTGVTPPPSVTCQDATININGSAFTTVPSGGLLNIGVEYQTSVSNPIHSIVGDNIIIVDPIPVICEDATYNLLNSLAQNKGTGTIASGATESINLSDSVVDVYLDAVLVGSASVPYGNNEIINVTFS